MRIRIPAAFSAIAVASMMTGCGDSYFQGPRLNENPNLPSKATADQQFTGFQAFAFYTLTGDLNRDPSGDVEEDNDVAGRDAEHL